ASGDLAVGAVTSAALAGAVLGDQTGYRFGAFGRTRITSYISARPKRAALFSRAQGFTARWGGPGVFLSRWLISPLGPYVNFASGITRQSWTGFTLWAILGEIIWVLLYVGLGFTFAQNIDAVAEIAADMSGIIAGGTLTIGLGLWLRRVLRDHRLTKPDENTVKNPEENNVQRPDHPH
ncbi:MAG: DedA family protein, partial [Rhodobacterales bacterium]|nr:DedA family protein [Rhodobacterales bacterium]